MTKKNNLRIRNSTAEFLIFSRQAGENSIERVEDETVWLTQKLIAVLFEVTVPTVSEHLANIYQQRELNQEATVRNFRIVQTEGNREVARNVDCYNQAAAGRGLRENMESNHLQRNIRSHFLRLSTVGLSNRSRTSQISQELKQRL